MESIDQARHIVDVLEDRKAENIVLLDLRPDVIIADFFVICTGNSDRQLKALVDHVREAMKDRYQELPVSVEGTAESGWILLDYSNIVVHLFQAQQRSYYNLEGLWSEANIVVSIQ